MAEENCVFCKIVNGEIPANIIYENEDVISFLDINPVNIGHALVIPRDHHDRFDDLPDDLASAIIIASKKVGKSLEKSVGAKGYNLGLNNGPVAGQVVGHVHMHVMPRFSKDGLKLWPKREIEPEELERVADKIRLEIEDN